MANTYADNILTMRTNNPGKSLVSLREYLNGEAAVFLKEYGFAYDQKQQRFVRAEGGVTHEYVIHLTGKAGYYTNHLMLSVFDEPAGKYRERLKALMPFDEPLTDLSETLQKKREKNLSLVADLTDWKELDEEGKLHFWFESFAAVERIYDLREQLALSAALAMNWFELCRDVDYLVSYNLSRMSGPAVETGLLLLALQGDYEKLEASYKTVIDVRKRKKLPCAAIERFYKTIREERMLH